MTDVKARIDRIWRWYKRRPSSLLREVLVEHYVDLLPRVARHLRARLPAAVEIDDLIADGALGLLDAIDKFVPGKSSFPTFSQKRIRGAMIDGLRSRDPISRSARQTLRKLEEVANDIRVTAGLNPTPQELAQRLGVPLEAYGRQELLSREVITRSLSGGRMRGDDGDAELSADRLPDPRQESPSHALLRQSVKEMIITGFSRAERLIVVLYYYEGLSMREIGLALDLSESRICQMHASILVQLKARICETQLQI